MTGTTSVMFFSYMCKHEYSQTRDDSLFPNTDSMFIVNYLCESV